MEAVAANKEEHRAALQDSNKRTDGGATAEELGQADHQKRPKLDDEAAAVADDQLAAGAKAAEQEAAADVTDAPARADADEAAVADTDPPTAAVTEAAADADKAPAAENANGAAVDVEPAAADAVVEQQDAQDKDQSVKKPAVPDLRKDFPPLSKATDVTKPADARAATDQAAA